MSFGFHRIEILALLGGMGLLGILFELVRRRKVKERYSLLWFGTGLTVLAMTWKREWLESFSAMIGVYYAPNSIFLVISVFMILILIHFSVVISQLISQNQKLGQKLALLEERLESLPASPSHSRVHGSLSLVHVEDESLSEIL